jgi:signal transduction histidine kinase
LKTKLLRSWVDARLGLRALSLGDPSDRSIAVVGRAFLTTTVGFLLLQLVVQVISGYNARTSLFVTAVLCCALLVLGRWLIGAGRPRAGVWLGAGVFVFIAAYASWFSGFIGVAQASWIVVAVTYSTMVLGMREGAITAAIALAVQAGVAVAIGTGAAPPRLVPHPFNQWLNVFTPCMVLLFSAGLIRQALIDAVVREVASAAAAVREREQRLHESLAAQAKLEDTVQQRTAELRHAVADLRVLTHLLSHDMKGKVSVIGGFASAVAEAAGERLGPDDIRRLGRIDANARDLHSMIDAVLSYTQARGLQPVMEHVDLAAVVAKISLDVREQFPRAEITADGLGPVTSDAVMVRHILQNLIVNACVHSGTATPRIEVTQEQTDALVTLCVADNGVGVPADRLEQVFGLFHKSEAGSGHGPSPGHGVGLPIVRQLVEKLGGRAWAESSGSGARFLFTLPRHGVTARG